MRKSLRNALILVVSLSLAPSAFAGGYDTPILYSARHMGMGGAAIGYVDDPSAIFHNPAGLGRIGKASLLADFSLLLGRVNGSPNTEGMTPINKESELTVAPFFLLGGAFRITDWLVAGIGAYPVASAGASYKYDVGGSAYEDTTKLFFLEVSPAVAFSLPGRVTLGLGYRITYVSLNRVQENTDAGIKVHDFSPSGLNFLGFRAGAQWEAIPEHLSIGVSYRHKTVTEVDVDKGVAIGSDATDINTEFTLPSRLGAGIRGDFFNFGVAFDFEFGFNTQNKEATLEATPEGSSVAVPVPNTFKWSNNVTLRGGVEYNIALSETSIITPRIGYIFDSKTSNEKYVSAFGTPPAPTQSLTAGLGYDGGPWEVNAAYAYRFGSAKVDDPQGCAFCGFPGDYSMSMNALYVDFSWDFE